MNITFERLNMKVNLAKLITNNSSFLVSICAASCLFFSSIFAKEFLSPYEYGKLSLLITVISVIYSFGLLGSEQVLNRLAFVDEGNVELNQDSLLIALFSLFLSSGILVWAYYTDHFSDFSLLYIILVFFMSVIGMFIYNLTRLLQYLNLSQMFLNFWKLALLFSTIWAYFTKTDIFSVFLLIMVILLIVLMSKLFLSLTASKMSISNVTNIKPLHFFYASLLNMGGITLLGYGDRFLIENSLGIEQLGRYFYWATILIFPFIIFANYIGFRKLVDYKTKFSLEVMKNDIVKVSLFSFLAIFFASLVAPIISNSGLLNIEPIGTVEIILFLILGGSRLIYSVVSAALGAVALPKYLSLSNIFFIAFAFGSAFIFSYESFTTVLSFFILLWMVRICFGFLTVLMSERIVSK